MTEFDSGAMVSISEGSYQQGSLLAKVRVFFRVLCSKKPEDEEDSGQVVPSTGEFSPKRKSNSALRYEEERLKAVFFAQSTLYGIIVFAMILLVSIALIVVAINSDEEGFYSIARGCTVRFFFRLTFLFPT